MARIRIATFSSTGKVLEFDEADGTLYLNGEPANPTAELQPPISFEDSRAGESSYQTLSADLTLDADAGRDSPDTAQLGPIMGNVMGDSLTKDGNYLFGVRGAYSITGAGASTQPKGAVLASIEDGATDADGAVVAWIDGSDPSSQTNAKAAFKVRYLNNHEDSGFDYGLDMYDPSAAPFDPLSFKKGEMRLSNGQEIYTGSATTRAGVRAQVGEAGAIGSKYFSSAGKEYLKVDDAAADTDWEKVTTSAAD